MFGGFYHLSPAPLLKNASPLAGAQVGSNSHWLFALLSEGEGEKRDGCSKIIFCESVANLPAPQFEI